MQRKHFMENNKILKYLEGQLTGQIKQDFEALIESNSELQYEVETLANLIDEEPMENPPYHLRQKIYNMVGIKDDSFMDIVVKKAGQMIDVIIGNEYTLDISPKFVTRGSQKSILFSKKMNHFDILCDVFYEEADNYVLNLAASKKSKEINNLKFLITQNDNVIEKFTQKDGNTGSFILNEGIYSINISLKSKEIGNIKINLS
tara:strand:+ start:2279 stop:2887 length:609 start_codon:yes stop_codon:yes gene_type:complete